MPDPRLQVAFDEGTRSEIFDGLAAAIAGGADCVEIGTPLLKLYGSEIVWEARKRIIGPISLYVDVKMIDFPQLELPAVLRAGADEVSVLACATDAALAEAVAITEPYNALVTLSTMGYPLSLLRDRLQRARLLGLSAFIAHGAGADLRTAFSEARQRAEVIQTVDQAKLTIGGGITIADMQHVASLHPTTVIVGRSLTHANDIEKAVRDFKCQLEEANAAINAH
jgi:3-hexulose-6-phosphate synthase/6-phospho-3-hexuloisomerase